MSSGFITESEIARQKELKSEEWKRNRKEGEAEDVPDEAIHDHRSLYEKLKEQKDKKQEDWEEAHKFKNMIRGLEDDEVGFLEDIDNVKYIEEKKIKDEDKSALEDFRKKVNDMQKRISESELNAELNNITSKKLHSKKVHSQSALLAGAIKRKYTDKDQNIKRLKSEDSPETQSSDKEQISNDLVTNEDPVGRDNSVLKCAGILPGLGQYTDSSESDNCSSSDELSHFTKTTSDLTGRRIVSRSRKKGGECLC